jgi:hypothetical protein
MSDIKSEKLIRTFTVVDKMPEILDCLFYEAKNILIEYLNSEKPDSLPSLNCDLDYDGSINELVDSCVPVYTNQIKDLWYIYDDEFEESYMSAGVGSNPRENNGMAAIYFYLSDQLNDWYDKNAEEIFDNWQLLQPKEEDTEQEEEEEDEDQENSNDLN